MSSPESIAPGGGEPAAPALPDFYTDPNAVLKDENAVWRFGKAPDYSRTRAFFEQTKRSSHEPNSLPQLVENLVKNWEIEASFKTRLQDWRTISQSRYSFGMNGIDKLSNEYMLKQGTYNGILGENEYYSPKYNDFSLSHKTFKRMMPIFAWEVLEVYSGPPKVAFRWRHWGEMKNDYVAYNTHGEKVTAPAHDRLIDIEGLTVADLDDEMRVVHLETWFDPLTMFRQIAPNGITKVASASKSAEDLPSQVRVEDIHNDGTREYGSHPEDPPPASDVDPTFQPTDFRPKHVAQDASAVESDDNPHPGAVDATSDVDELDASGVQFFDAPEDQEMRQEFALRDAESAGSRHVRASDHETLPVKEQVKSSLPDGQISQENPMPCAFEHGANHSEGTRALSLGLHAELEDMPRKTLVQSHAETPAARPGALDTQDGTQEHPQSSTAPQIDTVPPSDTQRHRQQNGQKLSPSTSTELLAKLSGEDQKATRDPEQTTAAIHEPQAVVAGHPQAMTRDPQQAVSTHLPQSVTTNLQRAMFSEHGSSTQLKEVGKGGHTAAHPDTSLTDPQERSSSDHGDKTPTLRSVVSSQALRDIPELAASADAVHAHADGQDDLVAASAGGGCPFMNMSRGQHPPNGRPLLPSS